MIEVHDTLRADAMLGTVPGGTTVQRALQAVRQHLGMSVAYVSRFEGDRAVFREVDAPGLEAMIKPGDSQSLDDVYCRHILAGRLPELIPDTAAEPFAMALPITKAISIGSHMSIPIRLPDGSPYGMFCCLGFAADQSLNPRDLQMMRAFAELAAFEINRDLEGTAAKRACSARIEAVLADRSFGIVYQPIVNLDTDGVVGFECLSRFATVPQRTPDLWFAEAAVVGMGATLEIAAIEAALAAHAVLPPSTYLAVNASPETIMSAGFAQALRSVDPTRLVLEITEHASIGDYAGLLATLDDLRGLGMRLAVDDAGAGYASFQHILDLRPDLIKLDMSLTRNIDLDLGRQALTAAMVGFARQTGSRIIAEGVETAAELAALRALGIDRAQGYFLGRPSSLADAVQLCAETAALHETVAVA